jgi:hypothetical protein
MDGWERKRRLKTYKIISHVGEMEQYGGRVNQDDGSDLIRYYGIFQKVCSNY